MPEVKPEESKRSEHVNKHVRGCKNTARLEISRSPLLRKTLPSVFVKGAQKGM